MFRAQNRLLRKTATLTQILSPRNSAAANQCPDTYQLAGEEQIHKKSKSTQFRQFVKDLEYILVYECLDYI